MKTKLFSCLLFCAALAFSQAVAQDASYVENAVYVRFKETASPKTAGNSRLAPVEKEASLRKLQKEYGLHQTMFCMRTLGQSVLERTFEIRFDSTAKAEELVRRLRQDSRIELVERIPVYYVQGLPAEAPAPQAEDGADPLYQTNYGSWHLKLIHAEEAWAQQTGTANVKVAVVDNAVWGNHPDLGIAAENQYNVRTGQTGNSAPPSDVSQDPDCPNVINCPSYNWSHGTHCAGAVGAIRGNGIGIASIGSGITLMGVSCPGTDPSGLAMDNGFTGISWAAEHGAKVISLSWGRYMITETDRAIVQACIDKGIVIVAAAGNDRTTNPMYPGYLPGVISVAAVNDNRQISSFSNYGDWVTVASPGGFMVEKNEETKNCILSSTYCTSQNYRTSIHLELAGQYYDGMYGTSMATPVVSGLCGLLLSADTTLDSYLMRDILMSSAQNIDESNNKNICANSGIIDAAAALRAVRKNRIARPEGLKAERENRQLKLTWRKPQTENAVASYQVFVDNVFVGETKETEFKHEITKTDKMFRLGVRALYENGDTSLRAGTDLTVPTLYDVELTLRPKGCGTLEGAGAYQKDENIRIVAHAAPGCTFSRWMEDEKSLGRDTVLDYTVTTPTSIEAVFTGQPTVANDALETASALRVYPNPANGRITVDGGGSYFYTVEIYASNGQRVLVQHFAQGAQKQEIDLGNLFPGTYLAKILTANGWQVVKIAKI